MSSICASSSHASFLLNDPKLSVYCLITTFPGKIIGPTHTTKTKAQMTLIPLVFWPELDLKSKKSSTMLFVFIQSVVYLMFTTFYTSY